MKRSYRDGDSFIQVSPPSTVNPEFRHSLVYVVKSRFFGTCSTRETAFAYFPYDLTKDFSKEEIIKLISREEQRRTEAELKRVKDQLDMRKNYFDKLRTSLTNESPESPSAVGYARYR